MPQLESRLLIVTDRHQTNSRPLLSVLERVLKSGSPSIHIRERDLSSKDLLTLVHDVRTLITSRGGQLVINDRIDLALALDGVGVHLRGDSLPVSLARRLLGSRRLLGVSTHSVAEVVRAESEGADYVVLGPIYATVSKQRFGPALGLQPLEKASRTVRIPVLGIGGITIARAAEVRRAGAFGAAVIGAILSAADVERATRDMLDSLSTSL